MYFESQPTSSFQQPRVSRSTTEVACCAGFIQKIYYHKIFCTHTWSTLSNHRLTAPHGVLKAALLNTDAGMDPTVISQVLSVQNPTPHSSLGCTLACPSDQKHRAWTHFPGLLSAFGKPQEPQDAEPSPQAAGPSSTGWAGATWGNLSSGKLHEAKSAERRRPQLRGLPANSGSSAGIISPAAITTQSCCLSLPMSKSLTITRLGPVAKEPVALGVASAAPCAAACATLLTGEGDGHQAGQEGHREPFLGPCLLWKAAKMGADSSSFAGGMDTVCTLA